MINYIDPLCYVVHDVIEYSSITRDLLFMYKEKQN